LAGVTVKPLFAPKTCAHTGPGFVVKSPVPGGSTGLNEPASVRLSPKK
jgi:hypothetical protein